MPIVTTNFIAGRMNKSVDERLLPPGEYIDALNVRLGATETTEIGAVENSKGNDKLTTVEFLNTALSATAVCIGAYEDGTREIFIGLYMTKTLQHNQVVPLILE